MPQLNFSIPDSLLERIDEAKPDFLSRAAFLSLLIDQTLDRGARLPAYCVGAGTRDEDPSAAMQHLQAQQAQQPAASTGACLQEEEKIEPKKNRLLKAKKTNDPFVKRVVTGDHVPEELDDCADLIVEFWAVKKGTRSERVWNRICQKLIGWPVKQRREALERAIAAGWADVFEPPVPRTASAKQLPEPSRHPAAREFRNGAFVDEGPTTNPMLEGLI